MRFKSRTFQVTLLVASIIFAMGMTTVPASAIDLGAKGKYIISVKPAARAAIETAVLKAGGKLTNKYSFAGNTSMKQEASSFSWSAQVN